MNLIYGVIGTYALSNCSGSSLAKKQFFIKSPRPSFLIKRAAPGNLKASFHCTHWHRFFPLKRAFSKTYPSFLTLKEGSTSHLGLLPSGKKRETALLGAQNRYALRLAGHQSLRIFCGMGPPGCCGGRSNAASKPSPCCAGWTAWEQQFIVYS